MCRVKLKWRVGPGGRRVRRSERGPGWTAAFAFAECWRWERRGLILPGVVAVTAPRFLIPSLLWYGPAPPVDQPRRGASVPDLTDGGWGGLVASEDIVTQLLLALDPVTVLLSLAGYANPEIVLGIPSVAAETPEADLISIDLASMSIGRGPAHAWVPAGGAVAQVAVWVEPRDPSGRPAVAAGTTLDLSATGTAFADDSISLEFA